jgi:hypothetical protein
MSAESSLVLAAREPLALPAVFVLAVFSSLFITKVWVEKEQTPQNFRFG